MAHTKCTMFFNYRSNAAGNSVGGREGGWSESFYHEGEPSDTIRSLWQTVCVQRARMLSPSTSIVGQRYQRVEPTVGNSTLGGQNTPGAYAALTDVPQMAILARLAAVGLANSRQCILRGIPDSIVVEGEYNPTRDFTNAFSGWLASLFNGSFQFKGRNLSEARAPITSISALGAFVLANVFTFAQGDLVQLLNVEGAFGEPLGGFYRIATVTNSREGILANWKGGAVEGGSMRQATTVWPNVNPGQSNIVRVIVRKVGRPSGGYRGRASARR